ncbi:MAG TPA: hypothetical protein VEJ37_12080 [Xanthobacteraceae bacterium]|nr:hypothetical protein [Xanthobacteraceae bacterium]
MVRVFALTGAAILTAGTLALAQLPPQPPPVANPLLGQGTDEERAACHPDVVKFCQQLLNGSDDADVFGILDCLKTNRTRISGNCQQVLASHGQ